MNQLSPRASLLERAAEVFDFDAFARAPVAAPPIVETPVAPPVETPVAPTAPKRVRTGGKHVVDRDRLAARGFISPDAPVGELAEEFRIVKRQLLRNRAAQADGRNAAILVGSAQAGEGKTFCAINLALSLAGEQDLEVLLVDGDFGKPEIVATLGLEDGPGFIDAIADPHADPEAFVIRTDVPGLSVLPAGRGADNVTELLASDRTADVLERLSVNRSNRIILFDSSPALRASPAAALAGRVGQVLMVVRADTTTEADLREAVGLLSACPAISLMLNAAALRPSGRRFGGYYGQSA